MVCLSRTTLGVVGGMGPAATAYFYSCVIAECQQKFAATNDDDYPRIFIDSIPVPDFLEERQPSDLILGYLLSSAATLQAVGADCVAMPCCSAHYFSVHIRNAIAIPFVDLVETVVREAVDKRYRKVALLATPLTQNSGIFDRPLRAHGIDVIWPGDILAVRDIIRRIMAGAAGSADSARLCGMVADVAAQGAEAVVLGCTELPLVLPAGCAVIPALDPVRLLARRCVEFLVSRSVVMSKPVGA